jgi:hypothetical protein
MSQDNEDYRDRAMFGTLAPNDGLTGGFFDELIGFGPLDRLDQSDSPGSGFNPAGAYHSSPPSSGHTSASASVGAAPAAASSRAKKADSMSAANLSRYGVAGPPKPIGATVSIGDALKATLDDAIARSALKQRRGTGAAAVAASAASSGALAPARAADDDGFGGEDDADEVSSTDEAQMGGGGKKQRRTQGERLERRCVQE